MYKNKKIVLPDGYVTQLIVTSWDKELKDFKILLLSHKNDSQKYILPEKFVNIEQKETALQTAKKLMKKRLCTEGVMFRHIAVFDELDENGDYTISNVMVVIVDDVDKIKEFNNYRDYDVFIYSLSKVETLTTFFQHGMVNKFKTIIDYDVYSQIFDTQKFGSEFIVSLLGQEFTTSNLICLAKWAGRKENKTTFYRNIDHNYQYVRKNGRKKYYTKKL